MNDEMTNKMAVLLPETQPKTVKSSNWCCFGGEKIYVRPKNSIRDLSAW